MPSLLSWVRPGNRETTSRDFLLKINTILRKARLGLGYRQFDRMLMYVASAQPFLKEDSALDYQLTQVVLPRLRSASPSYREALEALRDEIARERFPARPTSWRECLRPRTRTTSSSSFDAGRSAKYHVDINIYVAKPE